MSMSQVSTSTSTSKILTLQDVVKELTTFAPLHLAGSWDNVGLLLEPIPSSDHTISHITLTNDLTAPVLSESITSHTSLIISYHPPIFSAWKRLTHSDPKQSIMLKCATHHIAVYSPHTSWDACERGVNTWLASGCGNEQEIQSVSVLEPSRDPSSPPYLLRVYSSSAPLLSALTSIGLTCPDPNANANANATSPILFHAQKSHLAKIEACVQQHAPGTCWDISSLESRTTPSRGQGRLVTLREAIPLSTFITRVKKHLNLPHVQISIPYNEEQKQQSPENVMIRTIALCAGSGGSVISGTKADVFWTGEMGHHDVLAAQARGISVVLCHHSNTERGYLQVFRQILSERLNAQGHNIPITISTSDADPLVIM